MAARDEAEHPRRYFSIRPRANLTNLRPYGVRAEGVVVEPLSDTSLCFQICVIMRTDDD